MRLAELRALQVGRARALLAPGCPRLCQGTAHLWLFPKEGTAGSKWLTRTPLERTEHCLGTTSLRERRGSGQTLGFSPALSHRLRKAWAGSTPVQMKGEGMQHMWVPWRLYQGRAHAHKPLLFWEQVLKPASLQAEINSLRQKWDFTLMKIIIATSMRSATVRNVIFPSHKYSESPLKDAVSAI